MTVDSGLRRLLVVYMMQGIEGGKAARQRGREELPTPTGNFYFLKSTYMGGSYWRVRPTNRFNTDQLT
jgi:hypothetical protein